MTYDVAIIGAGIVGSCIARELSKYKLAVCMIEKADDVSCGTSKANSGIVHAGYDPVPGSLMAKLNVEGTAMYKQLSQELHFDYKNVNKNVNGIIYKIFHVIWTLNTKASTMKQVNDLVKKERAKEMLKLSRELEIDYFKRFLNKKMEVLIERKGDVYSVGHTTNYLMVKIKNKQFNSEEMVNVIIKDIEYPFVIGEEYE